MKSKKAPPKKTKKKAPSKKTMKVSGKTPKKALPELTMVDALRVLCTAVMEINPRSFSHFSDNERATIVRELITTMDLSIESMIKGLLLVAADEVFGEDEDDLDDDELDDDDLDDDDLDDELEEDDDE